MKVLACDRVDPAAVAIIRAAGHEVAEANALKGADLVAALAGVSGLVVRGATKVVALVLTQFLHIAMAVAGIYAVVTLSVGGQG